MNWNPFRRLTVFQQMAERQKGAMEQKRLAERLHPPPKTVRMDEQLIAEVLRDCRDYLVDNETGPPVLLGSFGQALHTPGGSWVPVGPTLRVISSEEAADGGQ